jgi:hypothetical protein
LKLFFATHIPQSNKAFLHLFFSQEKYQAGSYFIGEYENTEQYLQALELRGYEKLYERRKRESFDAVANTNSNLSYRKDFDLGDIVTVRSNLLGLSKRLRITEIIETYDENGLHVDLLFGDPLPTLGERLKGVI